ncbi:MAG TPA: FkbM family methyltransferase [Ramlibacter sp.]|nr:FkbM family methyltransferase [Ramlibacter sp.]
MSALPIDTAGWHRDAGLRLVAFLLRALPNRLRGKMRLARLLTRLVGRRAPVRLQDHLGNQIWCPSIDEPISQHLFANGVYEPDTQRIVLNFLRPGGCFLDVGANVGAIAVPVASARPDARVLCVEGDPDIVEFLQRNVQRNLCTGVTVVGVLVGAASAQVPFHQAPAHKFGMGSIGTQFGGSPILLQQLSLDTVMDDAGIEAVDVVKIDIEGAELGALQGLRRRLTSASPPVVVFEFVDWAEPQIAGQAPGDAQRFLLGLGYRLFRLGASGTVTDELSGPLTTGSTMIVALPFGRQTP